MRDCVFNGAALTALIAVILTITCSLLCNSILHILSVPSDIYADAYRYLIVIFLGIPFTLMYNYLSSILRSVGDSRTPFLFLAFSAGLNIFLDLFCIIVLHWGCMGAAIATVTAQAVSAVLCLLFIKKKMPLLWLEKENRIMQRNTSAELLKMGLPTGFQFSITAIGQYGDAVCQQWTGQYLCIGFYSRYAGSNNLPCARLMHSVQQLLYFAARIWELERLSRVKKGFWEGISVAVLYGLFAGVILVFLGRPLSMIFIKKDAVEVLDASAKYLRCMGYFYWSLGILNVARMVTQGLGYSGRAVFSGVTEMIARTVVSLGFVGTYGYTAICFADQTAWVSACIYIVPTCILCMKKSIKMLEERETLREA